ncbi:hypothetical protein QC761_0051030 [Podospora bellae-mahoneyi]|uniref:C2H2-type domain-containing protein n=1 Tax=Podospora bellae-mahoneyi TaxID=2093777 RepID=A0ABR0FJY4_9PEZI|nr:hypothetical protein QC761_0051030 [Podospora bellae-mahoneyi]
MPNLFCSSKKITPPSQRHHFSYILIPANTLNLTRQFLFIFYLDLLESIVEHCPVPSSILPTWNSAHQSQQLTMTSPKINMWLERARGELTSSELVELLTAIGKHLADHEEQPGIHTLLEGASPRTDKDTDLASLLCMLCLEIGKTTSFKYKADLVTHLLNFHLKNHCRWECPQSGCGKPFDSTHGMKEHLKEAGHEMIHCGKLEDLLEDCKTALCPQVVFACGAKVCREVVIVSDPSEPARIAATAKDYCKHIANHVVLGHEWSFSNRLGNLMRQDGVYEAFTARGNNVEHFNWQPHTSFVLKKVLETRHFNAQDIKLLVLWAEKLGFGSYSLPTSPILTEPLLSISLPKKSESCAWCNKSPTALFPHGIPFHGFSYSQASETPTGVASLPASSHVEFVAAQNEMGRSLTGIKSNLEGYPLGTAVPGGHGQLYNNYPSTSQQPSTTRPASLMGDMHAPHEPLSGINDTLRGLPLAGTGSLFSAGQTAGAFGMRTNDPSASQQAYTPWPDLVMDEYDAPHEMDQEDTPVWTRNTNGH